MDKRPHPMVRPGMKPAKVLDQLEELEDIVETKPFESRKQWAWAFANKQPWARRWAHETPGGKGVRYRRLPTKVTGKMLSTKSHDTVMIALMLPPEAAERIFRETIRHVGPTHALPPEELHITLVCLGKMDEVAPAGQAVAAAVTNYAVDHIMWYEGQPVSVKVGGTGRFMPEEGPAGETPLFLTVDSKTLQKCQINLLAELEDQGVQVDTEHAFYPHITVAYLPPGAPTPTILFEPFDIEFEAITIAWGDVHADFALTPPSRPPPGITYTTKPATRPGGKRNYAARAGQQIAGNLCRSASGKFGACGGGGGGSAKKPDRLFSPDQPGGGGGGSGSGGGKGAGGKGGAGKEGKVLEADLTPEQRQAKLSAEQAKKQTDTLAKLNIAPDGVRALQDMLNGKQPDGEAVKRGGFVEAGLMEQAQDGTYRMTAAGRQMMRAAAQEDQGRAGDIISESRDRVAERRQRDEERGKPKLAIERGRPGGLGPGTKLGDLIKQGPGGDQKVEPKKGGGGGGKKKPDSRKTKWPAPTRGAPQGPTEIPVPPGGGPGPSRAQPPSGPGRVDRGPVQRRPRRRPQPQIPKRGENRGPIAQKEFKALEGGFTTFKQRDGRLRWVMLSSNPYEDKDAQYVTQKSLETDVARTDVSGDYGPLRWWHLGSVVWGTPGDWTTVKAGPGIDFGLCDFSSMAGRMLVESGTFYNDAIGVKIARKADQLQASLGFAHPPDEPDRDGAYWHIKRFERSLTPKGKASNPFTSFSVKELKMSQLPDKKVAALKALGLDDDDVEEISSMAQVAQKEADTSGVTFKAYTANDFATASTEDLTTMTTVLRGQLEALQSAIALKAGETEELEAEGGEESVELKADEDEDVEYMDEGEEAYLDDEEFGEPTVGSLTVSEFQQLLVDAVTEALGPTNKQLDLSTKMTSALEEMKSIITSKSMTTKSAEDTDEKGSLADLQVQVKQAQEMLAELGGTVPRAVQSSYRPSRDATNVIDPAHSLATKEAQEAANGQSPLSWVDSFVFGANGNGNGVQA